MTRDEEFRVVPERDFGEALGLSWESGAPHSHALLTYEGRLQDGTPCLVSVRADDRHSPSRPDATTLLLFIGFAEMRWDAFSKGTRDKAEYTRAELDRIQALIDKQ